MNTPPALQRREYKCLVDEEMVERIRRYIAGICVADSYAHTDGRYTIDTLYLDSPRLDTYWATTEDRGDRYKLRVRGYPRAPSAPTFLEVKRRVGDTIRKTRVAIQGDWSEVLEGGPLPALVPKQRAAFDNFLCHYHYLPMRPTVLVRYEREPYFSQIDDYARITFDRSLSFQLATNLTLSPASSQWTAMDHAVALRGVVPAASIVLLELKFTNLAPAWMRRLVQTFGLQRLSFCKYTRAIDGSVYACQSRVARAGFRQ